ncbi:MAG: potassium transporter Kup [Deltaproteobacteria bacterium]|nr:potassium transporter Kup [Deltaproteobacteria bacterium]
MKSSNAKQLGLLSFGTLGIVYGDIGTSPLYAFRLCFSSPHPFPVNTQNVYGVLSLILWSLTLVISIKYLLLVLRADNKGEGGILALANLALTRRLSKKKHLSTLILTLGIFGAALLYGDGMITPALSVLSAVEGLQVATPFFTPWIIPLTLIILTGLFFLQPRGTLGVSTLFSPIIFLWFLILAVLGTHEIIANPQILQAINPQYAIRFFAQNTWFGTLVLGSVFLVVTGGEALYADLGHFGQGPIRLSWFSLVFPCLLLNYFGQGAFLLKHPETLSHLFFAMAPTWALYPLVLLATLATIIASQAIISGSFSLTHQGMQLDFFPRVEVRHTSSKAKGQIYVPITNWLLFVGTLLLVVGFQESDSLAAAYGIAVSTTMVITTFLLFFVMTEKWKWRLFKSIVITLLLLVIDFSFFISLLNKIPHGGWVPLVVALLIYLAMTTWRKGQKLFGTQLQKRGIPIKDFFEMIKKDPPNRPEGVVVYLSKQPYSAPPALRYNYKINRSVHQNILLLCVRQYAYPHVTKENRYQIRDLKNGFYQIIIKYGFMDEIDVPKVMKKISKEDIKINFKFNPEELTYVITHEAVIPTKKTGMAKWREKLYSFLFRNSVRATRFFNLPYQRVLEIDPQVEI